MREYIVQLTLSKDGVEEERTPRIVPSENVAGLLEKIIRSLPEDGFEGVTTTGILVKEVF